MSPRRLVATLLEADDMLPSDSIDTKSFTARVASDQPLPVQGAPISGTHSRWAEKFRQTRLHRDGPEEYFKVDRNTWLVRDTVSGEISVRYHTTDIITVTPGDTLTVGVGTWTTVSSLSRLNDWLPSGWGLYTQSHTWYWTNWGHREENQGYKRLQPYSNGDQITSDGTLYPKAGPKFKRTRVKQRADL